MQSSSSMWSGMGFLTKFSVSRRDQPKGCAHKLELINTAAVAYQCRTATRIALTVNILPSLGNNAQVWILKMAYSSSICKQMHPLHFHWHQQDKNNLSHSKFASEASNFFVGPVLKTLWRLRFGGNKPELLVLILLKSLSKFKFVLPFLYMNDYTSTIWCEWKDRFRARLRVLTCSRPELWFMLRSIISNAKVYF